MPSPTKLATSDLEHILELACRAPSGGNGQPWSFAWDGEHLEIFIDKARTPRVADPELLGSWVQAGIILECVDIAASTKGWALSYELHQPHVPGKPFITATFVPTAAPVNPLASTLAVRYTDRRPYLGGSLTAPVFEETRADFEGAPANLHYARLDSDDLVDYLVEGEGLFQSWPELHRDTWIFQRWSREDAARRGDGVHYQASGFTYVMSRVLKVLGDNPAVIQELERRGLLRKLLRKRALRNMRSAAGVALLTVRSKSMDALVPTGRLAMRSWLRAQAAGYSTHTYGPPAVFLFFKAMGLLPREVPPRLPPLLEQGERILRRDFDIPADEIPILLWRIGLCPGPLPEEMRTYRRPLSDILTIRP